MGGQIFPATVFTGNVWFGIQLQLSKLIGDTWNGRINGSSFNVSGTESFAAQCVRVAISQSQFTHFLQLKAVCRYCAGFLLSDLKLWVDTNGHCLMDNKSRSQVLIHFLYDGNDVQIDISPGIVNWCVVSAFVVVVPGFSYVRLFFPLLRPFNFRQSFLCSMLCAFIWWWHILLQWHGKS